MICSNCQAENRPDRRFCLRCGQPLAVQCPNCGASNEPEAAFCGDCGTRLGGAQPGLGATPAETAVGSTIAAGQGASAGPAAGDSGRTSERRLVTVLFADLVGYTTLAERLDPEDARDLLDRYFGTAREIVQRYGGTIEKFIGDAVMAVWGTPTAHEDDAERAVRAAMDLTVAIPGLKEASTGPALQLRAGVLSGEAAVNLAADGQAMVAGDLVNTASRLQSVAPAGTVLVGETTMRSASGAITFESVGAQQLKGREGPVPAWRPVAVVGKVGGAGRAAVVEPPFVGRDAEFSALKERLHATSRDGRARLVSVTGVAGIGKSRLAWELEKYLDGLVETVYWHHGRSPAYGEGLAFWALGEMVRRRAGIAERDDPATTAAKLDSALAEWITDGEERRWVGPRLRTLLGLEDAPPGTRDEMFAAWRTFFDRIAERGTTVLVFEDLQWADAGLVDFIESLLEWSRAKPLLIVTLARPELTEQRPTWGLGQREFTSLSLQPLPRAVMSDLVRGIAPGLPDDAIQRIAERSEGIPLYAVELFRMLLDRGDLAAGPDGYRVTGAISEIHAPHSLQALISARLDALPAEDRRLLQDAAVLGKTFTIDALAAISGAERGHIETSLRGLVRREFLTVDADPRSPERGQYGFVGALVREVAYGTLSKRDRRERHLAAARYFESLGDDELAGMLASHYTDAFSASTPGPEADAVAAQARIALRAAADRSLALASPAQAATYLRRTLEVTRDPADVARVHHDIAYAEQLAGNWTKSGAEATLSEAAFRALGDPDGVARAALILGESHLVASDLDAAEGVLLSALGNLPETGGERLAVELRAKLARTAMLRGDAGRALPLTETALEAAAPLDMVEAIADLIVTRAWALSGLNRSRESEATLLGAIAYADAEGLRRVRFRAINNLGATRGEFQPRQIFELVRSAMAEAERVGDRDWADKLAFAALMAMLTGDWEFADATLAARWRDDQPPLTWIAPAIVRIAIDTCRGRTTEAERVLAELRRRTAGTMAVQDEYGVRVGEFYFHHVSGPADAALRAGYATIAAAKASSYDAAEAYAFTAFGAAAADAMDALRDVAGQIRTESESADVLTATGRFIDAVLAARAGRASEAERGFAAARDLLQGVGHELWTVFVDVEVVGSLTPDAPIAAVALAHARAFIDAHGAEGLRELLDARLAQRRDQSTGRDGSPRRSAVDQPAGTPANVLTTS